MPEAAICLASKGSPFNRCRGQSRTKKAPESTSALIKYVAMSGAEGVSACIEADGDMAPCQHISIGVAQASKRLAPALLPIGEDGAPMSSLERANEGMILWWVAEMGQVEQQQCQKHEIEREKPPSSKALPEASHDVDKGGRGEAGELKYRRQLGRGLFRRSEVKGDAVFCKYTADERQSICEGPSAGV